MRARIFIAALTAASLLSFSAYAAANNHSTVSQKGFGNTVGVGQISAFGGKNTSTITQKGFDNFAVTGQAAAFGGSNTSTVTQTGAGNTAVTEQGAF
jgi:hypothetical protein